MIETSWISGTFVIVERPSASSVAAISLRTLFLAPRTGSVPFTDVRPRTTILSSMFWLFLLCRPAAHRGW